MIPPCNQSRVMALQALRLSVSSTLLVALLLAGKVGEALAPSLTTQAHSSVLLLLLNANDLHLLLTAGKCSAAGGIYALLWWIIGVSRRVVEDCFFFWIGRRHGVEVEQVCGFGEHGQPHTQNTSKPRCFYRWPTTFCA